VGGAIKQKSIEAPDIENEMEDCEECTATLSFYVISGSDLSQVHMVIENLRVTGYIPNEGGCDRSTTSRDTSGEGVRAMIGAQFQSALKPMWWLDISGQVYSQWRGDDEYEDKCKIDFHGYCPMLKINELEDICLG